ncbi:hypothetical protein CLV29_2653 [Naumannella halotolerans]|uniref:Uncharacterized protein n=1 Tax=Naumannella halotolerans TaxID=993414 RepID=A0A4R7J4D8_9ACTN|nr:hypothetical protein CLV29_2653 [Naumannella halotolerans]
MPGSHVAEFTDQMATPDFTIGGRGAGMNR